MNQSLIIICAALVVAGCATHGPRAAMTSGEIGCPTSELQVSDGDMGWTTNTWKATCRGKTFYCTYTTSMNLGSRTQCKEEISAPSK
jgi:hypothetical protein